MILSNTVKIKVSTKNLHIYIAKGYNTKVGQEIEINIYDLPNNSSMLVDCKCDYCNQELKKIWSRVNPNRKINYKTELKICCINCQKYKTREICLEKYGVVNVFAVKNIKEKIKEKKIETCLKNYKVKYPAQSKEIYDKLKQTNLEKYGVVIPTQNEKVREKLEGNPLTKKILINREGYIKINELIVKYKFI